jgi:ferritin-like metal-binding protein YciE
VVKLDSLQDVLAASLADLFSTETQLIDALPRLSAAAFDSSLRGALVSHLEQTRRHRSRLVAVIEIVDLDVPATDCEAIGGLIRDADRIAQRGAPSDVRDAALIAATQRIEHFEIASYTTACALAAELFFGDAERSLGKTLDEELDADRQLSRLAHGSAFTTGVHDRALG